LYFNLNNFSFTTYQLTIYKANVCIYIFTIYRLVIRCFCLYNITDPWWWLHLYFNLNNFSFTIYQLTIYKANVCIFTIYRLVISCFCLYNITDPWWWLQYVAEKCRSLKLVLWSSWQWNLYMIRLYPCIQWSNDTYTNENCKPDDITLISLFYVSANCLQIV